MYLLPVILILALVLSKSVLGLLPALINGNASITISSPSPFLTFPTTIASAAPVVSAASNVTCPLCQIVATAGPLSKVFWWDKTLSLTLDTISVLITQYNNTAIAHTTTIFDDILSINTSTITEAQSIASSFLNRGGDPDYVASSFGLNNGTNAFVDGQFSIAYPTPFMALQGFVYASLTPQQDPQCPKNPHLGWPLQTNCTCWMEVYDAAHNRPVTTVSSIVTLSSAYYEPKDGLIGGGDEPFLFNNVSFSNFIESALGSEEFNKYRSCAFIDAAAGPPALMIPVAALTATITSTTKSAGNYGLSTPQPGSPIEPIAAPRTSTPAAPPLKPSVEPKPDKPPQLESSTAPYTAPQTVHLAEPPAPTMNRPASPPTAGGSSVNEPATTGPLLPAVSPSDNSNTGKTSDEGAQPNVELPSGSGENEQTDIGAQTAPETSSESHISDGSDATNAGSALVAAPAISYAGSFITPDKSSYYNVPQIGKLSPGGPPMTTNKIVYSLAPSATALISNGQKISLPTFAVAVSDTVEQVAASALRFAGSTYTFDSSLHIVISGQTIVPGASAIIVAGTPISLAQGASVAVVGGTTQSLYHPVPTVYPEITFAGATYTADSNSAIIIQGQTLVPGSPAITISSTPISIAPGASVIVIAGQTQSLIPAGQTAGPVITFDGSTYTANAASAFAIGGQTLTPGGAITVSGTAISLATDVSSAIIAGSTQSLMLAPIPTGLPTFVFKGSTYTAHSGSDFIIGGQTLTEGGLLTVAGTPISYASNGGDVVVGTSTEAVKIGGLIMNGFGSGGASSTGPIQFTGSAVRYKSELPWWLIWLSLGGMMLLGLE